MADIAHACELKIYGNFKNLAQQELSVRAYDSASRFDQVENLIGGRRARYIFLVLFN